MKKISEFIKKNYIKIILSIVIVSIIFDIQYKNFTGYCDEDERYYTKQELLEKFYSTFRDK